MTALLKNENNIVPFVKGNKMVDKFERGYVPSSRLYRYEVRPFLTDAARNVYAELEDRINGFKDKTTDHVSYSQLQGGKLEGAKKISAMTVRKGLKELIDLGVISVVSESSRKGNEYQINEVSLVEHFKKCSTTTKSVVLQNMDSTTTESVVIGTTKSVDTIELTHRITIIELLNNTLRAKNPLQSHFFEYQEIKKQNLLDQQKMEAEQKAKSVAERKEKTRKLSFDEVMDLTTTNIQKLCSPNLWEQFVTNRSEYKKTALTKNALKTIHDEFKAWGIEKSDISLKTAIKGNHQGLFEPRISLSSNFSNQTQASTRMSEIQELIAQEEQGNATYGF
ncbi:hypothetical protein [Acinetobacter celticus]|uniref:Replication protein n=1 Tax=Acinetobacter celticus TaxID=1891224 RepID=A0A1C3CVC3_9GAMM|nr:hypothetical protein [Acinetobacter celticus]ODA12629.1 hypothetical protein BBP83_08675 [Acinetobacter celticus]